MNYKDVLTPPEQIEREAAERRRAEAMRRADRVAAIKEYLATGSEMPTDDARRARYPDSTIQLMQRGDAIRERRLALGWSVRELAQRVGVSDGTVHNVQAGNGGYGDHIFRRIVDILAEAECDLFMEEDAATEVNSSVAPNIGYTETPMLAMNEMITKDEALENGARRADANARTFDSLLARLPVFNSAWTETVQLRWFDSYDKLTAARKGE